MCEKELRKEILQRLKKAGRPCLPNELLDDLEEDGEDALDVRKALWYLLASQKVEMSPSRELFVSGSAG